jgi:hypothetical protein
MIRLIFRDYDRAGTEKLFELWSDPVLIPNVGDTVLLVGKEGYLVQARTFVYDSIIGKLSGVVYYVVPKGVSSGMSTVQRRSTQ